MTTINVPLKDRDMIFKYINTLAERTQPSSTNFDEESKDLLVTEKKLLDEWTRNLDDVDCKSAIDTLRSVLLKPFTLQQMKKQVLYWAVYNFEIHTLEQQHELQEMIYRAYFYLSPAPSPGEKLKFNFNHQRRR
ncbi:MAG: hypothetical protein Sylvanvirus14_22 [Sylvanvirus sp.]|uniref:Uncharacterized protein n=1 Tax=Sylvanvirus sp. TaxID=2487774 RepID=A0A3G5AIA3_9VIRU|nr:MAG: hypothetical protein Sylvanvirus14_22 [Sylvanvirus sp.]